MKLGEKLRELFASGAKKSELQELARTEPDLLVWKNSAFVDAGGRLHWKNYTRSPKWRWGREVPKYSYRAITFVGNKVIYQKSDRIPVSGVVRITTFATPIGEEGEFPQVSFLEYFSLEKYSRRKEKPEADRAEIKFGIKWGSCQCPYCGYGSKEHGFRAPGYYYCESCGGA